MNDHGKTVRGLHMTRVENKLGGGTPDVNLSYAGRDAWVELKGANRPARPTTAIRFKFQPGQIPWLEKRWRCGGLSWLYVRVGFGKVSRYVLCPGVPGLLGCVEQGMTEAQLAEASDLEPDHPFEEALSRFCHRLDYQS